MCGSPRHWQALQGVLGSETRHVDGQPSRGCPRARGAQLRGLLRIRPCGGSGGSGPANPSSQSRRPRGLAGGQAQAPGRANQSLPAYFAMATAEDTGASSWGAVRTSAPSILLPRGARNSDRRLGTLLGLNKHTPHLGMCVLGLDLKASLPVKAAVCSLACCFRPTSRPRWTRGWQSPVEPERLGCLPAALPNTSSGSIRGQRSQLPPPLPRLPASGRCSPLPPGTGTAWPVQPSCASDASPRTL